MTQPPNSVKHDLSDKASIRKELLQKRGQVDAAIRHQWDQKISENLLNLIDSKQLFDETIGVFSAIKAEPKLDFTYQIMHERGIKLALPIVIKKNFPLQFSKWAPNDLTILDNFGITIPFIHQLTTPNILIIPCVGFNHQGYRLGYGGGFYDRTLATSPKPLAIGIAYTNADAEFETSQHDIPMDILVTEKGITSFKK